MPMQSAWSCRERSVTASGRGLYKFVHCKEQLHHLPHPRVHWQLGACRPHAGAIDQPTVSSVSQVLAPASPSFCMCEDKHDCNQVTTQSVQ